VSCSLLNETIGLTDLLEDPKQVIKNLFPISELFDKLPLSFSLASAGAEREIGSVSER
jgi:hypothetical protein